jgi:predicted ATPase
VRSAYVEAVAHCTKGLEVLHTLPDTPGRAGHELAMQLLLGWALSLTKGNAAQEVGHAWARARALCHQVGDTAQLVRALVGLAVFHQQRGEYQTARELQEQLLLLTQDLQDPTLRMTAHSHVGVTLYYLGELTAAQAHLEQAIGLAVPQSDHSLTARYGQNIIVLCLGRAAWILSILGCPDQALTRNQEMLTYAQASSDAFRLAQALFNPVVLHRHRREAAAVQEHAEAALAIATEQGFGHLVPFATFNRGWALAAQGQREAGMAQMRQGLAALHTMGNRLALSELLALLAEAYGQSGQAEAGLRLLAEALAHVEYTSERLYEAEVYRIKGELLLQQTVPDVPQADACFQQALAVARRQQAKSWELRAAMSLARLWQREGKHAEARELLAPVYGWFTEGFDTADLQEARALLEALA